MSLKSAGTSIAITNNINVKLGYGYVGHNQETAAAEALRLAVEDFISSEQFKEFTTTSMWKDLNINLSFLVHTSLY